MGTRLREFLSGLAGTKCWHALRGAQWDVLLCGVFSRRLGNFLLFLAFSRASTQFCPRLKSNRFRTYLQVLANYCRCLRSNLRSLPRRPSFFDVVGCLVSSTRVDGRCRALLYQTKKNQTSAYRTKWNTQNTKFKTKTDGSLFLIRRKNAK